MENWRKFVKEADTDIDGDGDTDPKDVLAVAQAAVSGGDDSWKELYWELWSQIGYNDQSYYKYDKEIQDAIGQIDDPVDAYMEIRDQFGTHGGTLEDDTNFLDGVAARFPEISKKIRYRLSPDYDPGPAVSHDPNEPEEDL